LPEYLLNYNREKWSATIDAMKLYVKPEASPGVPYSLVSNRNDEVMERMGERLNDIILDRIEAMLHFSLDDIKNKSRRERIDDGLMDPVRVFVKNEPHKNDKVLEGRVRLIMSVSLADKIIEMLLSRHVCKEEIRNWKDIPSKPGIGFTHDDNLTVLNNVMSSGVPMSFSDVKGWDFNVKGWQIYDEAENIIKLSDKVSHDWEHLLRCKAILEAESVYQFSDGTLVETTYSGIVNSGKLRTSRGNSYMRKRIADLIGAHTCITAGDDAVEQTVPHPYEKYASYGIRLKDYQPVDDILGNFEFCSHIYSVRGTYSLNVEKMVMNLLHQNIESPLDFRLAMIGFQDELSSRDDYNDILDHIRSVGFYEVEGPHYIIENE